MSKEVVSKQAILKVLHDYVKQYKDHPWRSFISLIFPSLGSILVFFVPPLIVGKIIDKFVSLGNISFSPVWNLVLIFAILWLLGEVFWRVGIYFLIKLESEGIANLSKNAFSWLLNKDYDFYTDNFVGSLTKKALAFSRNFEVFTDTALFNVFTNIFPLIFVTIVLWRYSPWIPALLLICIIIVISLGLPIIKKRSKLVALRHEASSNLVGRLSDSVSNIFAIKAFAKEKRENISYEKYVDDYAQKFKKAANYQNNVLDNIFSPLYVLTNTIGLCAAIFFSSKLNLSTGTILVIFSYYSQITRIFWEINRTYRNFESSINEAGEFTQMFLKPSKILDITEALNLKFLTPEIVFSHVNFHYQENESVSFLNDFNLHIEKNQKVGLVGPSGGGKTTITKLLLRFIDLNSGSITIDGKDISKVTQKSLREAISYVPQEPLLFHRSLFENIAYAKDNVSKEEVFNAAKLARADEFIKDLSDGYETLVGERGIKLSGGQRQRVAIARAILKNSPILILDEATSSLDSESEKYIQEGLEELMKNKTAIFIAHRLSTVKHMDRIIVLDNGKIVEDGNHENLIKAEGLYSRLWSRQSGEFIEG